MAALQPPSRNDLAAEAKGKVVMITGGASGIGFATAKLFAACGAQVIVADVGGRGRLADAVAEIGHGSVPYECDVGSWPEQVRMFQEVATRHGSIDVAFLNAGTHREMQMVAGGAVEEAAKKRVECNLLVDEWMSEGTLREPSRAVFDVNLLGVMYGLKLAVHHMRQQAQGGRIVVTVSANAYMAIPSSPQYDASKHGVLGLMRSTAQIEELRDAGITVSALCPSLTHTPMTQVVATERTAGLKASTPEDVAQGVAWLVVHDKEEVRGRTVMVKGQQLREVEESYRQWMLPLFVG